jgi:hypothetical protein|tara:strand:+ start:232 stop:702 length:471 start_codon:yes stop_codon:yes gene_type:complete
MNKLSIKEEMRAIDQRDRGWWDSLTEEEQKKVNIFVLMRYTSAVQTKNYDIEYHYIKLTNELVNKHYNIIRHETQLQHKLLQCIGIGSSQFHPWIPPSKQKKGKAGKLLKWLQELYPTYNDDELELLVSSNTKQDFTELAEELGMDKKQIKELFKK